MNPRNNAFFPLYPYFIWTFTPLFFNEGFIAAYVIANLFSLLVPLYMYKLCCVFWTKDQAFRSTALLLACPTAFFLSVAYAEALYLSLCLMAFYYVLTKDVLKSSVLCFLVPLSRAQGLLFIAPMFVLLVEAVFSRKDAGGNAIGAFRTFLPPALATLAGVAAYFAWCQWQLGDLRAGLAAQRLYDGDNALGNLLHPARWFTNNFVNITLELHNYSTSMIDRGAFILCAPILIGVYRTQNKALFTHAATTMLIPALAGNFMSYTRVLLVVFPMFIYIGTRFKRCEYVAIPMFAPQVLLYLLHTGGYWVA